MHLSKIMLYGERHLHFTRFQFESSNLVNLVRAAMWRLISKKLLLLKLIYSPSCHFGCQKCLTIDTKIRAFSAHTNETNFENGSPRANGRSQLSAGSLLEVARWSKTPFQRRLSSSVQLLRPFFTTKVDTRAPVRFLTKHLLCGFETSIARWKERSEFCQNDAKRWAELKSSGMIMEYD